MSGGASGTIAAQFAVAGDLRERQPSIIAR
jgi:hypothetical protein